MDIALNKKLQSDLEKPVFISWSSGKVSWRLSAKLTWLWSPLELLILYSHQVTRGRTRWWVQQYRALVVQYYLILQNGPSVGM